MPKLIYNKKYKIRWVDIQSVVEWHTKEEILKIPEVVVEGVYFYVGRSKAGICFAAESSEEEFGNISIIPKSCIKKITPIK